MTYTNRLLLIDGYALLHRSFHALSANPLITSDGTNTSAAFGFMRTLVDLINKVSPTHLGVALDMGGKTFRHTMSSEYKANRGPLDPDIKKGRDIMREYLRILNVRELWAEGFEADDVLGSVAKHFASEDTQVLIYTPDKDLQQILAPHIQILKPKMGAAGFEIQTLEDLCAKYDIKRAEQFIEILALWGDSSDNIRGIDGIGEKTAAHLISKYGSIEYIYGNSANLTKKMAQALREGSERLKEALQLVTIRTDVLIPEKLTDYLLIDSIAPEAIRALNDKYEFRALGESIVQRFAKFSQVVETADTEPCNYRSVELPNEQERLLGDLGKVADSYSLVVAPDGSGLAIAYRSGEELQVDYIPFLESGMNATVRILEPFLARTELKVYGYELKSILKQLRACGVDLKAHLSDTLLAHYLLSPEGIHTLEVLVRETCRYNLPEELIAEAFTALLPLKQRDYICERARWIYTLGGDLEERLAQESLLAIYQKLEIPLLRVLTQMEENGVAIDVQVLEALHNELEQELLAVEKDIREQVGDPDFKISSPKQVGIFLFEKLKIVEKPKKTPTGQYNTSEEELKKYMTDFPVVASILNYRETAKLLTTYIDALPKLRDPATNLIHASFNQAVASTGRLSSSNPNLQNIPVRTPLGRKIRSAFVSRFEDGILLSADYSQIELRVLAHIANDEHMIAAFQNGEDIHATTAARMHNIALAEVTKEMRERAKRVNFGIVYGISVFGLARQIHTSAEEASAFIKSYFASYPSIEAFMQQTKEEGRRLGYVKTLWGRKRYIPTLNSDNQSVRNAAERMAINMPIQGTAADIIKVAMVKIVDRMREHNLRALLTTQVHDELIFDLPASELPILQELVRDTMQNVAQLRVPLLVDMTIGKNWGEL